MKISKFASSALLLSAIAAAPSALALTIIDTNPTWDGAVNFGWLGSGQSVTVPATDTTLTSFTVYADPASAGQQFDFYIFDAQNGGTTLFSVPNFVMAAGANTVNVNQSFTGGSQIFLQFDYNGFSGSALHFSYVDGYAGGNSSFGAVGSQSDWPTLDHRFIAEFTGGGTPTPDAGSMASLLGLGLAGLSLVRRKLA